MLQFVLWFVLHHTLIVMKQNVVLRFVIALTAFLPFETVAKSTLSIAALIFIFEPFPLARLFCLVSVAVVLGLTKLHKTLPPPQSEDDEGEVPAPDPSSKED